MRRDCRICRIRARSLADNPRWSRTLSRLKGDAMSRHIWRRYAGLAIAVLALGALAGCRSNFTTTRKGVTSLESAAAAAPHESVLETVANSKPDPNPIVPASYTVPAKSDNCGH